MTSSPARAELRGAARLAAVQALYQLELTGQSASKVVLQFRNHEFGYDGEEGFTVADEEFFEELVTGVVARQSDIDAAIAQRLSEKWKLSRLDATLRAIMRCGVFELIERYDVPARVVIDEYVTLATGFFDGPEPNFVNASLEKMAKAARAGEFG